MTMHSSAFFGQNLLDVLAQNTNYADYLPDYNDASDIRAMLSLNTYDDSGDNPVGTTALGYSDISATEHGSATGYTVGGLALNAAGGFTPALTISAGVMYWRIAKDPQWTTATITDAAGVHFYDNGPTGKPLICGLKFAAIGSSGGGFFLVDLDANFTVFDLDLQP